MNQITTLSGKKASILGLGTNPNMDSECISTAYQEGINYFFFYTFHRSDLVEKCRHLAQNYRSEIILATGSEKRNSNDLEAYRQEFCEQLSVKYIDVFFLEYISPKDDLLQVEQLINYFCGKKQV